MRKPEILFGEPDLFQRTRKSKAIRGVAFVDNAVVGFELRVSGYIRLKMGTISAARYVYDFFKKIFKKYRDSDLGRHTGLSKYFNGLLADWWVEKGSWDSILREINQKMGEEWESAFRVLLLESGEIFNNHLKDR